MTTYDATIRSVRSGQATYYYQVGLDYSLTSQTSETATYTVTASIKMSYTYDGSGGISATAPIEYWLSIGQDNFIKLVTYVGNIPWGTTPSASSSYPTNVQQITVNRPVSDTATYFTPRVYAKCLLETSTVSSVYANVLIPKRTKYTVSYASNGGTGAPGAQVKWHGVPITLSSTKPTRTGYGFSGWAVSPSTQVSYYPGNKYNANASVTLDAIWAPDASPTISNVKCERCTSDGTLSDEGTYAKINAVYKATTTNNSANKVTTAVATLGSRTSTTTINAATGSYSVVLGTFDGAKKYSGTVVFTDGNSRTTTVNINLPVVSYPIDVAYITETVSGETTEGYSLGFLGPASGTMDRINIYTDDIFIGDGANAGLYASTTGRNARVMLVHGQDGNGAGIEFGAGGLTIIGGGESATNLRTEYVTNGTMTDGTEHLMLGADNTAYIFSNCNTIADRKEFRFNTLGNFISPYGVYYGNDSGTDYGYVYATPTYTYVTSSNGTDGKRFQLSINTATGNIQERVHNGSGWGSWYNIGGLNHLTFGANAKINIGADAIIYINGLAYRMVFTSGGNIRVDTSSDSGASWTAGGGGYTPRGGSTASTLSHAANTVWAAPSGSAGMAEFRKLVKADLPAITKADLPAMAASDIPFNNNGCLTAGDTNGVPQYYIAASASKYTSADTTGWAVMKFSTGGGVGGYIYHAHGVVRISNVACTTAFGNGYISGSNRYIRLPHVARMIQSVTYGSSQGGAWLGMSFFSAGSNTDWCSQTDNIYNLPVRMFSPASRAASSNVTEGVYFIPVDVWFSSST